MSYFMHKLRAVVKF